MESLHTGYNSQNDKEKRVNFQFAGDEVIVSCIGSKTYGEAYEYFR